MLNRRNGLTQAVQQSYVQDLLNRERARMEEYIKAREYYDGAQQTQLTSRTRQFLNLRSDTDFTVNYCPTVVNAKADRLNVSGFDTEDDQNETLWRWWRHNRMDRTQGIVHRASVRDGDSFVLVEWDTVAQMPRFYFEPAYAGDGVMVYYSDERRDEIEFASKHWRVNRGPQTGKMRRLNLYYPDRIEKYVSRDDTAFGHWRPFVEEADAILPGRLGMAGVNWWTDDRTETGRPLGIPIVHFKHNDQGDHYGTSHLAPVMPVQDALNKAMIDVIAAADSNGFGLLVGYGSDKWSGVKVGPGAIAAVTSKYSDARLERLPGDDPRGLLAVYNALVMEIARISGTPLSYFQVSGNTPAEGTMKQQEIALISQVEKSQVDYGNAWEDCMQLARRLHNAFSEEPPLSEDVLIETIWDEAETRNAKEEAETLAIKVNQLGVSEEQAQIELGYDATQRAGFARAQRRRQALQLRRTVTLRQGQDTTEANETMTQTENEAGNEPERQTAA